MSVVLATMILNESEWIERLVRQHRDWSGLRKWIFVESADRAYAEAAPHMVNQHGLSVDGTTEMLESLSRADDRIVHIKHGFCGGSGDPAQAKCEARNRYLEIADEVEPTYIVTLDADEAYTVKHQWYVHEHFTNPINRHVLGMIFLRREIWRPPAIADRPLFDLEVVGGFWAIPCCHWWRWLPGMRYQGNHNNPKQADGRAMPFIDLRKTRERTPQMVHLGFAASERTRLAKNNYYAQRGEAVDPKRSWYVESRAAWAGWQPGVALPQGAKVIPYAGPEPEAYRD